ncbi:Membrane protein [Nocardioides sp. PD653]|nr:Membrane protein [Nocardioides sp. PD653]
MLGLRIREENPMIARFLDWLLGPRCNACGQRVYPSDMVGHYANDCPAVNR